MKKKWNGSKWIRPEKRLAIYLRDGLACCYCGQAIEDSGTSLTLDHLVPRSHGGSNEATNLVTACEKCNKSRQDRDWREFAKAVAGYLNTDPEAIIRRISSSRRRALPLAEAKALIERRGSIRQVLKEEEEK